MGTSKSFSDVKHSMVPNWGTLSSSLTSNCDSSVLPAQKLQNIMGNFVSAHSHIIEFDLFLKNYSKTSYIGEVGLDFSKEGMSTKNIQIETFSKILKVVSGQNKILSIHSRKAEKEVLELLINNNIKSAIFHWYSGGLNLIDKIVQEGYYFSINPAMTKSMSGRKIISKIPKQFVLTETDGPFIDENNLPIKPGQVQTVVSFLSNEWKSSEEEVKQIIWSNFQNIVNRLK